jgi:predicted DNA-binding transcriptional regulator YafY
MSQSQKQRSAKNLKGSRRESESSTFLKRSLLLQRELHKGRYPNAFTLAALCGCSRSTAMRTIDRLRYEFGVPIEYDESNRGYYLTNPDFSFASLPPGRDELLALILLSQIALTIHDSSLHAALNSLWLRITHGRVDIDSSIEHLQARFSIESGSASKLAGLDLLQLLDLCHRQTPVILHYHSPWNNGQEVLLVGQIVRLHLSDNILYVHLKDPHQREVPLAASFIRQAREVSEIPTWQRDEYPELTTKPLALERAHLFKAHKKQGPIEITIAPPASRYYAAQTWHLEQRDTWVGETLIRSLPSCSSLDLLNRILGLGRFVVSVKPRALLYQLREDVDRLAKLCC